MTSAQAVVRSFTSRYSLHGIGSLVITGEVIVRAAPLLFPMRARFCCG